MTRAALRLLLFAAIGVISVGRGSARAEARGSLGGYNRAIESASVRVVKLYGLGAGIQEGYGTGIVVSEDGLVVTVLSLLIDARVVRAIAHDGTRFEAHVVHRDPRRQLALLQLRESERSAHRTQRESARAKTRGSADGVGPLPFFDLAREMQEAMLRPGMWVLAAGNPFKIADGAEPVTVAHGVFSGWTRLDARRRVKDFPYHGEVLVIDAITSNPGAPGSALVDLEGDLVGMIGRVVLSNMTHTHFNYAIPREVLHAFMLEAAAPAPDAAMAAGQELPGTAHRAVARVDPGIRLTRAGYRKVLPFVERLRRDSPAARAGVRKDDLILSLNGQAMPDVAAYDARLSVLSPDEPIDLVIRRGRTILSIRIEGNVETSKRQNVEMAKRANSATEAQASAQRRDHEGADEESRPIPYTDTSSKTGNADYELLRATQEAFRRVAQRLHPCLVRIHTVGGSQPHGVIARPGRDDEDAPPPSPFRDSPGSGFIVADGPTTGITYSPDGYIITSSFNFVREPMLISVTLPDGRRLAADLIARDQVRKIALLKVEAAGLTVPEWADVEDLRVGQWAIALGHGFSQLQHADDPFVTVGIVSALNRMYGNAVQTDAKLSPANYGGPLCDISGRVIGICVPMAQRPGELAGIEMYDSGVGFAVPRRRVDDIVATLETGRSFYRGWLGIATNLSASGQLAVANVADPSPMHDAGVIPGDIIIGAEDRELHSFSHLMKALYMIPAGEQVHLQLARDETEFSVMVTLARATDLGQFPEPPERADPPDE
ncbi:MAG: S1C family serine protease [Planctomycetota bacterium]